MSRRVYTMDDVAFMKGRDPTDQVKWKSLEAQVKDQDFSEKVAKYVPTEILAAWTAIDGLLAAATNAPLYWGVFALLAILTPVYIWRLTEVPTLPAAKTQIAVATGAFIVWVFGMGGPFKTIQTAKMDPATGLAMVNETTGAAILQDWYAPVYGVVALILASLVIVILLKEKPAPGS